MDLMFNHIHQDLGRLRRLGQHSRGSLLDRLDAGQDYLSLRVQGHQVRHHHCQMVVYPLESLLHDQKHVHQKLCHLHLIVSFHYA